MCKRPSRNDWRVSRILLQVQKTHEYTGTPPSSWPNVHYFHAVFCKNWPNNKSAPIPFGVNIRLNPPPPAPNTLVLEILDPPLICVWHTDDSQHLYLILTLFCRCLWNGRQLGILTRMTAMLELPVLYRPSTSSSWNGRGTTSKTLHSAANM